MNLTAVWVFSVLGPLFLVLALWRWAQSGRRLVPQARAWGLVGLAFTAVALWLRLSAA